jgi:hypothetical protein
MLILDDGGQLQHDAGSHLDGRLRIVSIPKRYASLGAKRNASIGMAWDYFPDITAILPCDDDDLFLPWHLSSAAKALENAEWSRPSVILSARVIGDTWILTPTYTGRKDDNTKQRLYHPAWAMRLSAILRAGGYPPDQSGPEDQGLMRRMEADGVVEADPIALGCKPSYIYVWGASNISGLLNANDRNGVAAWCALCKKLEPAKLEPWEPIFDLHSPLIAPFIRERPF